MAETHVLSALHAKYRQIKGELAAFDNQCDKLRGQLVHLEQTITLFADDWTCEDATPKRPYRPRLDGLGAAKGCKRPCLYCERP